jgi:signal transduction histidine kinase
MNLLVNAGQAVSDHGEVCISTRLDQDSVIVAISDTGSGIPEDYLSRIFDPFFTTKPVGEGTGLGLSISYGIIERHRGTISVESQVGEGTTFTVRIPISLNLLELEVTNTLPEVLQ